MILTMKSDIYSFGMIIWEVLTGQIPWNELQNTSHLISIKVLKGNHSKQTKEQRTKMNNKLKGERPKIPSSCPKWMKQLLLEMWQIHPNMIPIATRVVLLLHPTLLISLCNKPITPLLTLKLTQQQSTTEHK